MSGVSCMRMLSGLIFFSFVFIHIVIIKFGGGQGWENKVQYIRGQLYAHVDLIKQLVPSNCQIGGWKLKGHFQYVRFQIK